MASPRKPAAAWRWVRHASARLEDVWQERLAFLGPGQVVIHQRPPTRMIRIEAYASDPARLRALRREYQGQVEKVDVAAVVARANLPRRPMRFGRDLLVMDEHGEAPPDTARQVLRVGAAMAFGTGEHATTASCLRLLCREARALGAARWTALDAGTGSGLLAMAAEKLGAARVEAFDFDPLSITAARRNARASGCVRVRFARRDILRWKPGGTRRRVVLANMFSELLIAASAKLAPCVEPGGCLILSGILRGQERETLRAYEARGLDLETVVRRGKWVTALLRQPALKTPVQSAGGGSRRKRPQRSR